MTTEQRDNSGTLSRNADKTKPDANPKWPDYKGSARIDGKDYWLAGWVKDGRDGKFLSLALNPKAEATKEAPPAEAANDDNLPF